MPNNTFFLTLLLFLFCFQTNAQVIENNTISFTPSIKKGTTLKYSVLTIREKLIDNGHELDSIAYQISVKLLTITDSTLIANITYNFSGVNSLQNDLLKGIKGQVSYNMYTDKYEVLNLPVVQKKLSKRIDRLQKKNIEDSTAYEKLTRLKKQFEDTKKIKSIYKEIKYIFSPYKNVYAYNYLHSDTAIKKDFLGKKTAEVSTYGVFKEDNSFVYKYNRNLLANDTKESLENQILKELQQADSTDIIDIQLDESTNMNQESYKIIRIVFDTNSQLIKTFSYEESKSFFGILMKTKKYYNLVE